MVYIETTFPYEERCKNLTKNRTFSGKILNLGLLSTTLGNTHKTPVKESANKYERGILTTYRGMRNTSSNCGWNATNGGMCLCSDSILFVLLPSALYVKYVC